MNQEQLLAFADEVDSLGEDAEWDALTTLIDCAHSHWAIDAVERDAFLKTLSNARGAGLPAVALGLTLELCQRIVPGVWNRGLAIVGPSDRFPTDFTGRWSVKLDGARVGGGRTLTLSVIAAVCRLVATERHRALSEEFRRQRREVDAEVDAVKADIERRLSRD